MHSALGASIRRFPFHISAQRHSTQQHARLLLASDHLVLIRGLYIARRRCYTLRDIWSAHGAHCVRRFGLTRVGHFVLRKAYDYFFVTLRTAEGPWAI